MTTREYFAAHIKPLESAALAGDLNAVRSLACMVLIAEGFGGPPDDGGCEIVDLSQYRLAA